ncbi:hypothetical protein SK128_007036, partial [Halocaridina rubra]
MATRSDSISMINVEVWLPPSEIGEYILPKMDCGSHATGSRFGWYISRNSLNASTELTDHWRSFKQLATAEIFSLTDNEFQVLVKYYTKNKSSG